MTRHELADAGTFTGPQAPLDISQCVHCRTILLLLSRMFLLSILAPGTHRESYRRVSSRGTRFWARDCAWN